MPRIAEITETKDGRPCVVLELSGNEGVVHFYTQEEIDDLLRREREACANVADEFSGIAAQRIREMD